MYTAVVIDPKDRIRLADAVMQQIPPWWEVIAHHMTINMDGVACGPCAEKLGERATLTAKKFAIDDRVASIEVETDIPSENKIKHITIAVNRQGGGKPFHSNKLEKWEPIPEFTVEGEIQECK